MPKQQKHRFFPVSGRCLCEAKSPRNPAERHLPRSTDSQILAVAAARTTFSPMPPSGRGGKGDVRPKSTKIQIYNYIYKTDAKTTKTPFLDGTRAGWGGQRSSQEGWRRSSEAVSMAHHSPLYQKCYSGCSHSTIFEEKQKRRYRSNLQPGHEERLHCQSIIQ